MTEDVLTSAKQDMEKTLTALRRELSHLRTGRASTAILEGITVDYYGARTPLNQVATLAAPEPTLLVVTPFDKSVAGAIEKAATARAFGADYVANILRQQQCPRREQPPLRLRDPRLNELVTDPLSLLVYDAFILQSEKESDDTPGTETPRSESDGHEPPSGDDPL